MAECVFAWFVDVLLLSTSMLLISQKICFVRVRGKGDDSYAVSEAILMKDRY